MKNKSRIIAGMLAGVMVISSTVLSAGTVSAATVSNSEKEEVIYIMLDANGNTDSVNVVNIFGKVHCEPGVVISPSSALLQSILKIYPSKVVMSMLLCCIL